MRNVASTVSGWKEDQVCGLVSSPPRRLSLVSANNDPRVSVPHEREREQLGPTVFARSVDFDRSIDRSRGGAPRNGMERNIRFRFDKKGGKVNINIRGGEVPRELHRNYQFMTGASGAHWIMANDVGTSLITGTARLFAKSKMHGYGPDRTGS